MRKTINYLIAQIKDEILEEPTKSDIEVLEDVIDVLNHRRTTSELEEMTIKELLEEYISICKEDY